MSFDNIAPHYRWMESVTAGSLLQCCRTQFIHEIKESRNILLLGEGRGRFLIEILRQNPHADITCVDASQRMLELTRTELGKGACPSSSSSTCAPDSRVRFVHADVLTADEDEIWHRNILPPSPGGEGWGEGERTDRKQSMYFDAVASHFFLDCFRPDQLERIASTVAACTVSGARWLVSDFCVPDKGWRRLRARMIIAGLYAFFRAVTRLPATRLTAPDGCLRRVGFQLRDRKYYNHGLLHSDVWVKSNRG